MADAHMATGLDAHDPHDATGHDHHDDSLTPGVHPHHGHVDGLLADHEQHHHQPHDPDATEADVEVDDDDASALAAAAAAATSVNNTPAAKERHSLTLDQRRALRRWANSQTIRPSHKTCIEWFYGRYGQNISQSTVSHSLSPKYSRLDGDNPQLSGSRLRFGNWPDVEKLVLLWYQQVQASGRQPTNEELGEKAKTIFAQLPRYKDENPPEFSPGWIHRFKKRYGLLVRRQRRHGDGSISPAEDINYLADCVPRFMAISPDTSPAAIRESVLRVVGVESTLQICALVRDEILRRAQNPPQQQQQQQPLPQQHPPSASGSPQVPPPLAPQPPTDPTLVPAQTADTTMYGAEDDPEVVLQNALRQLQQEEAEAEASAAAAREEREARERVQGTAAAALATPMAHHRAPSAARFTPMPPGSAGGGPSSLHGGGAHGDEMNLTPIKADDPVSSHDRPVRCPFCINQRMLRTIKEAVEHMSTHVVV